MTTDDPSVGVDGGGSGPRPFMAGWLTETRNLQIDAYDVDPAALEGAERAEYVRWNALAAIDEIAEVLAEIRWKPWAGRQGDFEDRDAYADEIVDVLHFVGNLAVAAGVTDDELSERYGRKVAVNRARRAHGDEGYDAAKAAETEDEVTATPVRHPLRRYRNVAVFWVDDAGDVAARMRAHMHTLPASRVTHSVTANGGSVSVDAEYLAHNANGSEIRRHAVMLAHRAGVRLTEDDVALALATPTVNEVVPCACSCPSPTPAVAGV